MYLLCHAYVDRIAISWVVVCGQKFKHESYTCLDIIFGVTKKYLEHKSDGPQ